MNESRWENLRMNPGVQVSVTAVRRSAAGRLAVLALTAVAVTLAACGDKKKDKPASQTAAKVNKEEITVHQINFVLSQQPLTKGRASGKPRRIVK